MKLIRVRYLVLFFIIIVIQGFASPKALKTSDIRPTMEEMFSYHIEYKEISPLLVKRSFKSYIEQFDVDKVFLLQDEISPFLEMSDDRLKKVVERYKADDFSDYLALNLVIHKAIDRARAWRAEIQRELILNSKIPDPVPGVSYTIYSESEKELRSRIKKQMVRFLLIEKNTGPDVAWTPERREKIFALWEKRLQRVEVPYVIHDPKGKLMTGGSSEHYLSLHVLKSMAKSLDAHTAYFSPAEAFEMRTSLEKQFEGVGVVLKETVDGVIIADLIKGGPAEKSGKIKVGDLLVEINGKSAIGASYDEVLDNMKGNGKGDLALGLKRFSKDNEQLVNVDLKREKIVMQDERLQYSSEPYGGGIIGKLNLPSFYESEGTFSCEMDIREALKNLKKQGNLVGLVLDLRENSGGFLNQAIKVAGLFVTSGVIVISKYSQGEIQYMRDIDGRVYYNGPLLILTSKISASAAEIVAQALQDYGAALVVGDERTYGKGSIQYQTVTDADAKAFFKVTVGKYYTVSGKSTQIEGVKADILVPTEYSIYNIGERFLDYPLKNDQIASAYVDPLSDLDQQAKRWFQRNYLPNLQKRESYWRKMLPALQANTAYRLKNNPNFKVFLKSLELHEEGYMTKDNWGVADLQMSEAVNILKDMILLQNEDVSAK